MFLGIAGAGLLYGLTPELDRGSLGTIKLNDRVTVAQGVGIELILTFVLVWAAFSSIDPVDITQVLEYRWPLGLHIPFATLLE